MLSRFFNAWGFSKTHLTIFKCVLQKILKMILKWFLKIVKLWHSEICQASLGEPSSVEFTCCCINERTCFDTPFQSHIDKRTCFLLLHQQKSVLWCAILILLHRVWCVFVTSFLQARAWRVFRGSHAVWEWQGDFAHESRWMHVMTCSTQPEFDILKEFGRIDNQQEQLSINICHSSPHAQFVWETSENTKFATISCPS